MNTRMLLKLSVVLVLVGNLEADPAVASIRISTVPALARVAFRVDGRVVYADARGRLNLPNTARHIRVLPWRRSGRTAYFRRWDDGVFSRARTLAPNGTFTVGYQVYARASPRFVDAGRPVGAPSPPPGSVLLMSSVGTYARFRPGDTIWLLARRCLRDPRSLRAAPVTWRVLKVDSHGANLVYRGQQSFDPLLQPRATVKLSYFNVLVRAEDALSGTPFTGSVTILLPDKSAMHLRIDDGSAVRARLPRGSYRVRIAASGLGVDQPFVVARDTAVSVRIFSPLDIGLIGALVIVSAGSLLLVGRPGVFSHALPRVRGTAKKDAGG
jgi:hypothetical protein